jgi:hypothetical protein
LLRVVVADMAAYDAFYRRLAAEERLQQFRHGARQGRDGAAAGGNSMA